MSGPNPQDPRYLTLAQASTIVAVSPRTLRRAIAAQHLCVHRLGRLVRIDVTELCRWVEANGAGHATAAATSDAQR